MFLNYSLAFLKVLFPRLLLSWRFFRRGYDRRLSRRENGNYSITRMGYDRRRGQRVFTLKKLKTDHTIKHDQYRNCDWKDAGNQ